MKKFRINEEQTKRGMNDLFYQIEIWNKNDENEKYSLKQTLNYMRKDADKVHQSPEFISIQNLENQDVNDEMAEDLKDNFKKLFNAFGELK